MKVKVGTYAGNSTDNTDITGVGFDPDMVIVVPDSAAVAVWRSSSMTGDSTASIFTDTSGTINANGRACASIVKAAFNTPTNAYLTDNVTTAQASVISFGF